MLEHINPAGMHSNPVYSQVVVMPAGARTVVVGGQNAVAADGTIVGIGDIGQQAAKAIDNLLTCLAAAGTTIENLVKISIYVVGDADLRPAFGAWMAQWGTRANPPAVSMIRVVGLGRPEFLIEIDAMAVIP